jgi:hypothetical protein
MRKLKKKNHKLRILNGEWVMSNVIRRWNTLFSLLKTSLPITMVAEEEEVVKSTLSSSSSPFPFTPLLLSPTPFPASSEAPTAFSKAISASLDALCTSFEVLSLKISSVGSSSITNRSGSTFPNRSHL